MVLNQHLYLMIYHVYLQLVMQKDLLILLRAT